MLFLKIHSPSIPKVDVYRHHQCETDYSSDIEKVIDVVLYS